MKLKTISGHYDTTISLDHNNRVFVPRNVDPCRTQNNFNVVRAGFAATDDFPEWGDMRQLWADYQLLETFDRRLDDIVTESSSMALILNYLETCPEQRFEELIDEALAGISEISEQEKVHTQQSLMSLIARAEENRQLEADSKECGKDRRIAQDKSR